MATQKSYKHFLVDKPLPYVAHVQINRPAKLNAFYEEMWLEFKVVFDTLSVDSEVRAIVLSGAGERAFTAGLDVEFASQQGILKTATDKTSDVARKAVAIKREVEEFQNCIGSVESCEKRMLVFYPPSFLSILNLEAFWDSVETQLANNPSCSRHLRPPWNLFRSRPRHIHLRRRPDRKRRCTDVHQRSRHRASR